MRQNSQLELPVEEYETRLAKLNKKMKAAGVDAVLVTAPANVRYFSGLRSIVWVSNSSMPGVVLMTVDGKMRVIGSGSNNPTARVTSCAEESEFYAYRGGTSIPNFAAALLTAMHDLKLENATIGLELGEGMRIRMTMNEYNAMLKEFPKANFVDAAPMIWSLRSVKSKLEQDLLRNSAVVMSDVMQLAFEYIVPGKTTEEELYQYMAAECFKRGAESMLELDVRGDKSRYGLFNCPPSRFPIGTEDGTIVLLDGGPRIRGYYSDIIRIGVIGKMSAEQEECWKVVEECNRAGIESLKPGRTVEEVAHIIDDSFARSSVASKYLTKGWVGHCVGLDVHEYPCLTYGDQSVIEPGMVFAVEPAVGDNKNIGTIDIEQNVLVTENGVEILSNAPRKVFQVG